MSAPLSAGDPGRRRRGGAWRLGGLLVCGPVALWLLVWLGSYTVRLPDFPDLRERWKPSEAYLLDRHGEVVHEQRMDRSIRRLAWVPIADLSPALIKAILLAEDRHFYGHGGVDGRALIGAAYGWLRTGQLRGASTLSMQLAGLLVPELGKPRQERRLARKLKQMSYALALERRWTKPQILEAYFNLVGFRGELQGIAASSHRLFGKHPSGLSEAEAILLAALLPAPNAALDRVRTRACAIARAGRFRADCTELKALVGDGLARPTTAIPEVDQLAPHLARRLLRRAGDRIVSTLDAHWQRLAITVLEQQLAGLSDRNVRDAAAVIVDNPTGAVLAYVGSAGLASSAAEVDGAAARRQAGSTLKPFLYGLALERRYLTPASILNDTPVNLETTSGLYIPQNYDRDFKGPVSARTALASSLNVPAVRTLVLVGVERLRDRLVDVGYAGLTESGEYYGFSLALGAAEVSLLEQVNAYRTLANGGLWSPLRYRPADAEVASRRVMSAEAAFLVADILSDGASRSVTFGLDSSLATRFWTAVKTGTSKDMRDNWCLGFSRRHTVGVWVGNFEGDAMRGVSGVSGAAPAWAAIMAALQAADPGSRPEPPPGLVQAAIRFDPAIEAPRQEWFVSGTETPVVRVGPPGRHRPRIASPPAGVIIALDPDIPANHQQVLFSASGGGTAEFLLDEALVGSASRPLKWLPRPGIHQLKLRRRSNGQILDSIAFQVRAPR